MKTKQETCRCSAYPFPHRKGGGACDPDGMCPHEIYRDEEYCEKCEEAERDDRRYPGRPHEFYD